MANSQSHGDKQKLIEMMGTVAKTDADVQALLNNYLNGYLQIQDGTIRSIQQANAVTELPLFVQADEKRDGIYSLSKGQLDKGVAFLVTGIQLLGYAATKTDPGTNQQVPLALSPKSQEEYNAMLVTDAFQVINTLPAVANGEFSIRINRKAVLDKLSNQLFNNVLGDGKQTLGLPGYFRLENPFLIKPEVPIEMNLRLPVATPASTLIEVVFHGAATLSA